MEASSVSIAQSSNANQSRGKMIDELILDLDEKKPVQGKSNAISHFEPAPIESQLYFRRKVAAPLM